jgi:hypothetical protein
VSPDHHRLLSGDSGWRSVRDDRRPAPADGGIESPGQQARPEPATAHEVASLMQEIDGLRRRLATQPCIEQAKGVLIGLYGIDADTAFAVLVRWSQHTNTKLHRLAADLVAAAAESSGQPCGGLHRFLNQLPDSGLSPRPTGRSS